MADQMRRQFTWSDWRLRMDELAWRSACADADEQAWHLRTFHDLITRAPMQALLEGVALPSIARLEEMLGCGACESLALAFVDPRTGCMISRGADGFHLASIALPGRAAEASASGATLALAVLGALAGAITSLSTGHALPGANTAQSSQLLH